MKLKELPKTELPRERLVNVGESKLTNEELLSIILRTGSKNNSVKDVSNNILSTINNIMVNSIKHVALPNQVITFITCVLELLINDLIIL